LWIFAWITRNSSTSIQLSQIHPVHYNIRYRAASTPENVGWQQALPVAPPPDPNVAEFRRVWRRVCVALLHTRALYLFTCIYHTYMHTIIFHTRIIFDHFFYNHFFFIIYTSHDNIRTPHHTTGTVVLPRRLSTVETHQGDVRYKLSRVDLFSTCFIWSKQIKIKLKQHK